MGTLQHIFNFATLAVICNLGLARSQFVKLGYMPWLVV